MQVKPNRCRTLGTMKVAQKWSQGTDHCAVHSSTHLRSTPLWVRCTIPNVGVRPFQSTEIVHPARLAPLRTCRARGERGNGAGAGGQSTPAHNFGPLALRSPGNAWGVPAFQRILAAVAAQSSRSRRPTISTGECELFLCVPNPHQQCSVPAPRRNFTADATRPPPHPRLWTLRMISAT